MRFAFVGAAIGTLLSGCASTFVTLDTGILPPPPKALSPIADLTKPDTMIALREEARLRATWQKRSDSTETGDPAARRRRARFAGAPGYPGELSPGRETTLLNEREAARKEGFLLWGPVNETEHTTVLAQSWGVLRTALRTDQEVTVRTLVWPARVGVEPAPRAEQIRFASEWIPLRRVSHQELKCETSGTAGVVDTLDTPVVIQRGEPAVRLIAHIEAAERPRWSAVTSGTELRGVTSCKASAVWADRVAEFSFDSWMAANRAVQLGSMPLITR